jgi:tetratricopeptide (TPR) repeat protein
VTHWLLLLIVMIGQDCHEAQDLGRRAYEQQRYEEATRHFTSAVTACGPSSPLLRALAQAQLLAQHPADALASLERIPAEDADYLPALKVKAKALYLLARGRDAVATLKEAAARAPADAEIPYDLGRIYYQQGRYVEAEQSLRRAITLDAAAYKAWDALGLAYEALGDRVKARQHYLKAIALVHKDHPDYDVVYANVADLLIKEGDYERAFDFAAEAGQRDPEEPRNLYLAGKALARLGRHDLSVRWFQQATRLNPDYAEAQYQLFQAYRALGRTADAEQALEAYKAATARAPKARR